MKASHQELLNYLANRDRLQVVTDLKDLSGRRPSVSVVRGHIGTSEIIVRIGNSVYSTYHNNHDVYDIAVVLAPAWRTEVNLAGITSTVPATPAH